MLTRTTAGRRCPVIIFPAHWRFISWGEKEKSYDFRVSVLFVVISLILALGSCPTQSPAALTVSTAAELAQAIEDANSGGDNEIYLQDGTYTLDNMLWVGADGVRVASVSGNREVVIIQGQGMLGGVSHIFNVAGDNFTVADITLRRVANHAIQMQPQADNLTMRNVHVLDTYEQMVKGSYDDTNPDQHSDNGLVENCVFEYSAGIGPQWYIGGIDVHQGRNWVVRGCAFWNIRSPSDDVAEHAIHFWNNSQNTLVERNLIVNCDRGIGFGLGDRGHVGGIIRNNMIYHDTSKGFADVGIALESSPDTMVYNNTVFHEHGYPNAIEYRFIETSAVLILNNLTNRAIASRDGGSGTVSHNVPGAQSSWFVDPPAGDLHLNSRIPSVVDQGQAAPGLTDDFDGDRRPMGAGIDIGADEFRRTASSMPWRLLLLME